MSRKFAVSALLLALIPAVAFHALAASSQPKDDIIRFGGKAPRTDLQPAPLEPGSMVNVQAGTPLASPGTFCTGDWMGQRVYRTNHTFCGGDVYYCLQDPSLTIPYTWNPAGCSPPFKFNVTAINMEVSKRPASEGPNPFTFNLQPIVFDVDLTSPGCPVPSGVKCAGPVYAVTLNGGATAGTTYKINLPFTIECCVNGPYFAAINLAGSWACDIAQVTTDDQTLSTTPPPPPPQVCHQYLYDAMLGARYDWVDDHYSNHLRLYSEGFTPNDPATQCGPGVCGWQWWYGLGRDVADPGSDPDLIAYAIPSTTGTRQKIAVRFPSVGLDTLKQIAFMGFAYVGTPDILVEVFGSAAGSSCGMPTKPGPLLYSVTIPNGGLVAPPLTNNVPIPDVVWGMLNGGPSKDIFVSISVAGGLPNRFALYARTKILGRCGDDPHTMFSVSGSWIYGGEYLGNDDEAYIDAYVCKEYLPPTPSTCLTAATDDWNTWMHDYQRTGTSAMKIDDPCGIRAKWSTFLPRLSSFTNPVVAGGKVYVSTDNEVSSYDLATGAPGHSVNAFPYMGGQVRSNVSVEGNRVFLTGGTGLSISCWDTTLTTPFWSNDMTDPGLTYTANGQLHSRNRFGVTAIYRVGTDSVIVVGTERPGVSGNGWLYALDAKTGFLYNGWATNPIPLDRGSIHSPAYDGTNLYVGTADFGTNHDGSLYSFNAATGVQNWNYKDALAPLEGWPGGVSIEGSFLYGATFYSDANLGASSGHRYAIDKSGSGPVVVWRYSEGPTLYASPTIGRGFLYIPQDSPSAGVLMILKLYGTAVYNFVAEGVGSVPQPVTLTCDNFLFAGDRLGYWYLLSAMDQSMEWRRSFTGIVNGTAIAHHFTTGEDYAVVSARSSETGPAGAGVVSAWRFHQPDRPFIHQYALSTEIEVPFHTGPGQFHTEAGVYGNDGCRDLFITATNLYDMSPSASAQSYSSLRAEYAAAVARIKVGEGYTAFFKGPAKQLRASGLALVDGELTSRDLAIEKANEGYRTSQHATGTLAAGTNILRTSNVTYSRNPIPPGGTTNISWNYDGTGLGRGIDDEIIETVNNDPDFFPEDLSYTHQISYPASYPSLTVRYMGGCPEENTTLTWNMLGMSNSEKVWNHGALGDASAGALVWGADGNYDRALYDGGFLLLGDSTAALGGAQLRIDYNGYQRLYLPDSRPSDSLCGFDAASNTHLGWRRQGGCPGQPVEILGGWVRSAFSDTNEYYPPTNPLSSMGVSVVQTEVGAYDPVYGDFKLISWKLENRDPVVKTLHAGSFVDWDAGAESVNDVGLLSDNFNGYAQWDAVTPRYAYGMFDPNLPTAYCGIDPTIHSPHKILSFLLDEWCFDYCWNGGYPPLGELYGWSLAMTAPFRQYQGGPQGPGGEKNDRGVFLVNKEFALPPNGSYNVVQAMYAVPATSNNVATIDALALEVAKRAARWAGFARGDVNDDGCVDLADVCWLMSGNQIYPDTYCGDVDNDSVVTTADRQYLLNYVSGIGPAPQGSWRFTF